MDKEKALHSQKTPSWLSYGVSFVSMFEKIDNVEIVTHWYITGFYFTVQDNENDKYTDM